MTGWETVSLIHGKGTGALREKLNDQLDEQAKKFINDPQLL